MTLSRKAEIVLLLFLASAVAKAQEHRFWDKPNKIAFGITAGIRAADIAQTCYHLSAYPGQWREKWLPTQNCAAIAGIIGSGQLTQTLAQAGAHRLGHHKIERALPWIWVAPNVGGIVVSLRWKK